MRISIKLLGLIGVFSSMSGALAQTDIYALMDRTDLPIEEIEKQADAFFLKAGTGKGSGYKQYQRWLYERKFHLDEKGFFISPEVEDKAYYDAIRKMSVTSRAGFTWKELGPKSWNFTSGWNPGVGRLTSVAVQLSDTNVIYVSSPGGGIWKTTDGGKNWSPLIDFVNSSWMNVFNICIDQSNPNVVYAALSSGGVIKSSNGGATWSNTGSGPSNSRQVRIFPSKSNMVFAAATNGLWRSVNAGTSWTRVENATKEDIEFNPANPAVMYASGNGGSSYVWRSADSGKTWKGIDSAAGMFKMGRTMLAVSKANPARVYVVQASGSVFGRFYKSNDTGKTFQVTVLGGSNGASRGVNFFGYGSDGKDTRGQATYDMAVEANPFNADEVYIAGIIVWKSINSGDSFTAMTEWFYPNGRGYNHADIHGLDWVKNTLYSCSDGGLYKFTGDEGWQDLSSGLGIRQVYRMACANTNSKTVTTGSQDNGSGYRKDDGTWADWLGADGMDNLISPTDEDLVYGTSQNGGIYKSTDGGESYMNLPKPSNGNWITPLAIHPTNHDTVWGGWTGVFRSDDGGFTWNQIAKSIKVTMDVLAVAPSNPRYIYAAKGSTLYRIVNAGDTWSAVTLPAAITSVFVSKYDPNKIWISLNSSSKRVLYSDNGGDSLADISAGLPSTSARSVVVDEDAAQTIYVGMNIGVYYRDTIGKAWAVHATGLPVVAVNEVEIQKSGAKLRVATYGRGIWESPLRNVSVPCDAPVSLSSQPLSNTSVKLSWNEDSDADGYDIFVRKQFDTGFVLLKSGVKNNTDTLKGLEPGRAYEWKVKRNCTWSSSALSGSSFVTGGVNSVLDITESGHDLKVYPNPTTGEISINADLAISGNTKIVIRQLNGAVVMQQQKSGYAGDNRWTINLSELKDGQYIIQVASGSSLLTKKLVLLR